MIEIITGGTVKVLEIDGDKSFSLDGWPIQRDEASKLINQARQTIPDTVQGLNSTDPVQYQKQLTQVLRELGTLNKMAALLISEVSEPAPAPKVQSAPTPIKSVVHVPAPPAPMKLVSVEPSPDWKNQNLKPGTFFAVYFYNNKKFGIEEIKAQNREAAQEFASKEQAKRKGCVQSRVYLTEKLAQMSAPRVKIAAAT